MVCRALKPVFDTDKQSTYFLTVLTVSRSNHWGKHPYDFGDRKVEITDPVTWIKNPLIDSGIPLSGFNDNFYGEAPDLGAFEVGSPPLQFGRRAYLDYNEDRAPWEIF